MCEYRWGAVGWASVLGTEAQPGVWIFPYCLKKESELELEVTALVLTCNGEAILAKRQVNPQLR